MAQMTLVRIVTGARWRAGCHGLAVLAAVGVSLLAGAGNAQASDTAVQALGGLNGVALACKQGALVARARDAVIEIAPKERAIGEVFEKATSDAYLARQQSGQACPEPRVLAEQIGTAIGQLKSAYPASQ